MITINSEYALDSINTTLQSYLGAELIKIQNESSSSIVTPTPQEYKIGEWDNDILTMYPSILIWSPYTRPSQDESGFQVRQIWFYVVAWITENDLSNLHRFICRYSDAIGRVLRNESYLKPYLTNPVIGDANNTDLYQTDVGFAQGTRLEGTFDYIMADYT